MVLSNINVTNEMTTIDRISPICQRIFDWSATNWNTYYRR